MEGTLHTVLANSSETSDVVKIGVPVLVALLTGIIVPVIMRLLQRASDRNAHLESKKDETSAKQLEKLSDTVDRLKEAHEELHREFLTRHTSCQNQFVADSKYKDDLKVQRALLKTIHTMLKRQADLFSEYEDED